MNNGSTGLQTHPDLGLTASLTLHLLPYGVGSCEIEVTGEDSASPPLRVTKSLFLHVRAVNEAPSFLLLTQHLLVVEGSGSQHVEGVLENVSTGEASWSKETQRQLILKSLDGRRAGAYA